MAYAQSDIRKIAANLESRRAHLNSPMKYRSSVLIIIIIVRVQLQLSRFHLASVFLAFSRRLLLR